VRHHYVQLGEDAVGQVSLRCIYCRDLRWVSKQNLGATIEGLDALGDCTSVVCPFRLIQSTETSHSARLVQCDGEHCPLWDRDAETCGVAGLLQNIASIDDSLSHLGVIEMDLDTLAKK
jgi:hypothetical protein